MSLRPPCSVSPIGFPELATIYYWNLMLGVVHSPHYGRATMSAVQRPSFFVAICMALVVNTPTYAQKWERILNDQAKIVFKNSDLDDARFSTWVKPDPAYNYVVRQSSQWWDGVFHRSILLYTKLSGERHYPTNWNFDNIRKYKSFKNQEVNFQ